MFPNILKLEMSLDTSLQSIKETRFSDLQSRFYIPIIQKLMNLGLLMTIKNISLPSLKWELLIGEKRLAIMRA